MLNGWSQFYRQTLLFGSFPTAETNALFSKYCYSIHNLFKDEGGGEERRWEERGGGGRRGGGERWRRKIFCVLFLDSLSDFAGRVRVSELSYSGSVYQVVKQVPQTFHHINCPSHTDLPEARFTYFTQQVRALLIVSGQVCLLG